MILYQCIEKMMLQNPFQEKNYSDQRDLKLISLALDGNKESLTELISRHQQYIYNVALKMTNNVEDSQDITQEILIKIVTSLAKYDSSKGKFRTWLYRITFNHFLNLEKQSYEKVMVSFDLFFDYIEGSAVTDLSETEEKEMQIEIKESQIGCMAGMLMCLDREQRLIYILGEIFEIDHLIGSEIFEISTDNFRQKLSRARKDLHQWMNRKCGLINQENPCRCPKKTRGFIENGWVTPGNLKWESNYIRKIKDLTGDKIEKTLLTVDELYARLYRDHPFKIQPKADHIISEIINNECLGTMFNLDG